MKLYLSDTENQLAKTAAELAANKIRQTISKKNTACFVAATGMSQIKFLKELTLQPDINWEKTTMFHLDEYIGIAENNPASFRSYLKRNLVDIVHPGEVYFINGTTKNPELECQRLNKLISNYSVDLTFVGIGTNGHLAFNDPPADFLIQDPYLVVTLDKINRQTQVKKGNFDSVNKVPKKAISMSVKQIMKSKEIFCLVSKENKAQIVAKTFLGRASPECPSSILQKHPNLSLFLDKKAAELLPNDFLKANKFSNKDVY